MLTCAITGSKGVLGSKLKKKIPLKFYEFHGNILNKKKVNQWIQKKDFDILIHLAALVPTNLVNKNYKKAYEVNVIGTNNLINSLIKKENKPKWLFFSSTSSIVCLNPIYIVPTFRRLLYRVNFCIRCLSRI